MDIMATTDDNLKIIVRAEKTGRYSFRVHKAMLIGPDKEVWGDEHLMDKECLGDDIHALLLETDVHDYIVDKLNSGKRCCGGGCH